jgi:ABC-type polysaccharide/polyol phosphate transport system ATPase subunit
MIRIDCQSVSKNFHRHSGRQLLRQHARRMFRAHRLTVFHALQDISFRVHSGESVGIVGRNGAGKSTLLAVISGLARPDAGNVTVNGRIAALLELGAGFHPDLTGSENLLLNAALLGFSEKEAHARFDEIVAFAGLEDFIEEPLRTYSSGMSLRLAFSIAINLDPEILIVDEVLAVGDQAFQQKCMARVHAFRQAGKTILAVSHSAAMLRGLCDRAIWLDSGRLVMDDSVNRVLDAYGAPAAPVTQPH